MVGRRITLLEVNKFTAGLITDANPLTFPKDASLDEENFILNIDGSRKRRLGLDFEDGYQTITTSIASASVSEPGFSSYKWDNAGGDPSQSILVVQIGNELKFFDFNVTPISNGLITTSLISGADPTVAFGYATVDSTLVVVTGQKNPLSYTFTAPSTIAQTTNTLLIRDLFGVDDFISVDLYDNLNVRPSSTTDAHTYNLRNQTWGLPRPQGSTETVDDPITYFKTQSSNLYPSNADTVNSVFYPDATDTGGPTLARFFAADLVKNPPGSVTAPRGFFIIDALARGPSRVSQAAANVTANPTLDFVITSLPTDTTPGGPTCTTEFAGRVWYGGFSGQLTGGDKRSPKMSSYLLFSKLVRTPNDISKCYQEADPTNPDQSDLVATDGGFVRINDAFGIQALVNVGTSLLIFATNGVWRLYGGNNYSFDATNYVVERITDHGMVSLNSLVIVDNTAMFWGENGIYHVRPDTGGWVCENITFGAIQTLYESISIADKQRVKGAFDSFERKVRWVYYNRLSDTTETKELVLDVNLKAFYLNGIRQFVNSAIPRLLTPFKVNPYVITETTTPIVDATVNVQAGGIDVVQTIPNVLGNTIKEIGYLVVTQISPVVQYTFAFYRNSSFRDWFSYDGVGVDADAYVVTGYIADAPSYNSYTVTKYENFTRYKQVPYIHVHCRRTETGFSTDINGDLYPNNPSSCLMQAQWEWANSANSKRWSGIIQAYRYKRLYMPVDANDPFDTGFATVVTKNKLRGKGKVLSLKFSTEPYKDLHLYGWSLDISVAESV